MPSRELVLGLPSALVLALLVVHSIRALPGRRAAAFWGGVTLYGVIRSLAVGWVTRAGLGAEFPYVIRDPLVQVLGVPLQEVAGWAIVVYLGWWLGCRLSRRLFAQIAWGCLFLAGASWAVESSAVGAGWWHWTVPLSGGLLGAVPFIGLVDWFFVGLDFLLPFAALTAPALRARPARFLTLLPFPAHFGAHLFVGRVAPWLPVPGLHLAHWSLCGLLIWIALRSPAEDRPFHEEPLLRAGWMPLAGLAIVLVDLAAVDLLALRRPELLFSVLPMIAIAVLALRPAAGYALGGAGLLLSPLVPPMLPAAVPALAGAVLALGQRHGRRLAPALVTALAVAALLVHASGARREAELTARLDAALAARDRGLLDEAERLLVSAAADFTGSHVPLALLAEIDYRRDRLDRARERYLEVLRIKQDDEAAHRHLAVIELRRDDPDAAASFAARGLRIAPGDPQLAYLLSRARGDPASEISAPPGDAAQARRLASLAFEVNDIEGAVVLLELGLQRWPGERWFWRTRVALALRVGDDATARRVAASWRERFPGDAEPGDLLRRLGVP